MLAIVLAHLDEAGDIGTIDRALGYFSGRLMLRWSTADEFLFLSGSTAQTLLALTGSNRHLVGDFEPTLGKVSMPGSSRVGVYRTLDQIFADAEEEQSEEETDLLAQLALSRGAAGSRRRGLHESFEFVARRLAYEDGYIAANWKVAADVEHLKDLDFKVLHGTRLPSVPRLIAAPAAGSDARWQLDARRPRSSASAAAPHCQTRGCGCAEQSRILSYSLIAT